MKTQLTRRGFLGIIGGFIAAATLPVKAKTASKTHFTDRFNEFHKKFRPVEPGQVIASGAEGGGAELARAIGVR